MQQWAVYHNPSFLFLRVSFKCFINTANRKAP